jgi:adenosine deaminase
MSSVGRRDLVTLPKAHLHLHLTGAMRHATLVELAAARGVVLPPALLADWPPQLSVADERGWFRFQRLYDLARSVLRTPADIARLLLEIAEDERREGSGWCEVQVDPSGFAALFGGLSPFCDLVLAAAERAATQTGVGVGVVIAANRTRHPLDARTLARLAAGLAGRGVLGFGLSNDERRGSVADFAPAFAIAERAGLARVPHAGELRGAEVVADTLRLLAPTRIGHGVRAAEDPAVLAAAVSAGTTFEVCPASNVSLGVYPEAAAVPIPVLRAAGARIALGADDPLLFGSRLVDQYVLVRDTFGLSDAELAELARDSVRASLAPVGLRDRLLGGIDAWLAAPPGVG